MTKKKCRVRVLGGCWDHQVRVLGGSWPKKFVSSGQRVRVLGGSQFAGNIDARSETCDFRLPYKNRIEEEAIPE